MSDLNDMVNALSHRIDYLKFENDNLSARVDALQKESVRNILLSICPGDDGMGVEGYANTIDDVISQLTLMSEEIEELRDRIDGGIRVHASRINHNSDQLVCADNENDDFNNATLILDEGVQL